MAQEEIPKKPECQKVMNPLNFLLTNPKSQKVSIRQNLIKRQREMFLIFFNSLKFKIWGSNE